METTGGAKKKATSELLKAVKDLKAQMTAATPAPLPLPSPAAVPGAVTTPAVPRNLAGVVHGPTLGGSVSAVEPALGPSIVPAQNPSPLSGMGLPGGKPQVMTSAKGGTQAVAAPSNLADIVAPKPRTLNPSSVFGFAPPGAQPQWGADQQPPVPSFDNAAPSGRWERQDNMASGVARQGLGALASMLPYPLNDRYAPQIDPNRGLQGPPDQSYLERPMDTSGNLTPEAFNFWMNQAQIASPVGPQSVGLGNADDILQRVTGLTREELDRLASTPNPIPAGPTTPLDWTDESLGIIRGRPARVGPRLDYPGRVEPTYSGTVPPAGPPVNPIVVPARTLTPAIQRTVDHFTGRPSVGPMSVVDAIEQLKVARAVDSNPQNIALIDNLIGGLENGRGLNYIDSGINFADPTTFRTATDNVENNIDEAWSVATGGTPVVNNADPYTYTSRINVTDPSTYRGGNAAEREWAGLTGGRQTALNPALERLSATPTGRTMQMWEKLGALGLLSAGGIAAGQALGNNPIGSAVSNLAGAFPEDLVGYSGRPYAPVSADPTLIPQYLRDFLDLANSTPERAQGIEYQARKEAEERAALAAQAEAARKARLIVNPYLQGAGTDLYGGTFPEQMGPLAENLPPPPVAQVETGPGKELPLDLTPDLTDTGSGLGKGLGTTPVGTLTAAGKNRVSGTGSMQPRAEGAADPNKVTTEGVAASTDTSTGGGGGGQSSGGGYSPDSEYYMPAPGAGSDFTREWDEEDARAITRATVGREMSKGELNAWIGAFYDEHKQYPWDDGPFDGYNNLIDHLMALGESQRAAAQGSYGSTTDATGNSMQDRGVTPGFWEDAYYNRYRFPSYAQGWEGSPQFDRDRNLQVGEYPGRFDPYWIAQRRMGNYDEAEANLRRPWAEYMPPADLSGGGGGIGGSGSAISWDPSWALSKGTLYNNQGLGSNW
jgi:hypothetical protein